MLPTIEDAKKWSPQSNLNMQAYTEFACRYEEKILGDILDRLHHYDGSVPPKNRRVAYAMRAYVYMSSGVEALNDELGGDISDELREFIYDLFDMNPSDDELTRDVVEYLNNNGDDIDNVNEAYECFVETELGYVPTKHQAKIIEDAARKKLEG